MRKIIIVAAVVVIALGAGFTYTLYKVGAVEEIYTGGNQRLLHSRIHVR